MVSSSGTALLATGLQDSDKALILFFFLITDSNTKLFSSASYNRLSLTANHPTIQLICLACVSGNTFFAPGGSPLNRLYEYVCIIIVINCNFMLKLLQYCNYTIKVLQIKLMLLLLLLLLVCAAPKGMFC